MDSSYSERGGLRFGKSYLFSFNYTFPLVKIRISDSNIEIRAPFKLIDIPKAEIASLNVYRGFFSKGIEIHHKLNNLPEYLVFWSLKLNKLTDALKKNGYCVEA